MYKVLVTGGIGSGKTTACKLFEELGVPVFYSDVQSARIVNQNKDVVSKIKNLFGEDIYIDGKLNRKSLAAIVFNDKEKLEDLNDIVHPAVGEAFEEFVKVNEEVFKDSEYVIEEAAIAIELGIQHRFDYTVVVTAPDDVRIERVMNRDNCTREQVIERINNQMPEDKRIDCADFVINNKDLHQLESHVKKVHEKILRLIEH